MARRPTYGERMAEWEEEQDRRNWKRSFLFAVEFKNYSKVEELIKDGIHEGYSFPEVNDPEVLKLLDQYLS